MMSCDCCPSPCCLSVRFRVRLYAFVIWMIISVPSICVTTILSLHTGPFLQGELESDLLDNDDDTEFACYENFTIYHPIFENAQFWIEGVLLIVVGVLGVLGNFLTLIVLSQSKRTNFHQLLVVLSVTDTILILIFIVMSFCNTVASDQPRWFLVLFADVLWPLGNITITASVLLVVAVSTERYFAICRPLQYKPSASFYIALVFATSLSVNVGRFLEFSSQSEDSGLQEPHSNESIIDYSYAPSDLMSDNRYVMFSRYWTEIIVTGILPLVALIGLNYGIYAKIRKSSKFRRLHENTIRFRRCGSSPNRPDRIRQSVNDITTDCPESRKSSPTSTGQVQTYKTSSFSLPTQGRPKNDLRKTCACNNFRRAVAPPNEVSLPTRVECCLDGSVSITLTVPQEASAPARPSRSRGERSTKLLVGIVVVFLVCHVVRLVIQIDAVVHPSTIGGRHFQYCQSRGKLHSPVAVWILTSFNVLCLVLNSSINFVVYCMVGRSFRGTLINLFTCKSGSGANRPVQERLNNHPTQDHENEHSSRVKVNGNKRK